MVDSHSQSFFGQSTGMIIQSSSKSEPFIFFKFLKKKEDGSWEKLSSGEGKTIKCGLEEIIMILEVLNKNIKSWSTVHSFKEEKTPISLNWEGDKKLWINVGEYPKMLSFTQIEILKLLLNHILLEKIKFSTSFIVNKPPPSFYTQDNQNIASQSNNKGDRLTIQEEMNLSENIKKMEGMIAGETEKAILISTDTGDEVWVPKSIIKSQYTSEKNKKQTFFVDSWFLEKNKLIKQKIA
ncbi:MAG: hypothetical protein ACFFCI_17235 [Promethearchaeota archaeon]